MPPLDDDPRPLGGYAVAMATYSAATGAFAAWYRASGRSLPDRADPYDLALVAMATHKTSRLITKDKVTAPVRAPFTEFEGAGTAPGEVSEKAKGTGLRRTLGELLTCPYCLSMWLATSFTAGMLVAPRLTRQITGVFSALFGSDMLQVIYRKSAA